MVISTIVYHVSEGTWEPQMLRTLRLLQYTLVYLNNQPTNMYLVPTMYKPES